MALVVRFGTLDDGFNVLDAYLEDELTFLSDLPLVTAWHVVLSAATNKDVTVPIHFSGTAQRNSDYVAAPTPGVVIAAGDYRASFAISTTPNETFEGDETVIMAFGSPTNAPNSNGCNRHPACVRRAFG